jgi:hypothetical protein
MCDQSVFPMCVLRVCVRAHAGFVCLLCVCARSPMRALARAPVRLCARAFARENELSDCFLSEWWREREREGGRERALLGTISRTGLSRARPGDRRCMALCGLEVVCFVGIAILTLNFVCLICLSGSLSRSILTQKQERCRRSSERRWGV